MRLMHGGDWAGYEEQYHRPFLDFSANISPLGVPEGVRQAIAEAAQTVDRYPDPLCRALCAAIAEREQVPAGFVLCGNGAAELIFRAVLARRPHRALLPAPTFAEYEAALQTVDCVPERYYLTPENGFALDEGFLRRIVPGVDQVFLCEPNNPTGRTTSRELLLRIAARCQKVGALLVLDECFNNFLDDPAAHSLVRELETNRNLLILKAFTKIYAMAGMRLGYCLCGDTGLLEAMRAAGQPWAVSGLAQAAGLAALQETAYVRQVQNLIRTERPRLTAGLKHLGLAVIPGEANYLLFQSTVPLDRLKQRGILLRGCGNYPGLDHTWYRTAVRTREENAVLLAALREVLTDG
ncbi:MAG: aminotransferase class I/II-fold pyridoxal phosphate-dependent enzyme [Candidatus Onthomonas sp.]|nr:aminotransferase class I/II-fold pyridoxal phosphate-dependent enzyme [Candidatus Onthomonas sp.]